ncbi:MAG: hypothetical protein HRT57_04700 [Crocinitomicaceae bacterium]|nr:hypothetical protein [Crocinitomicaceae bacterium]
MKKLEGYSSRIERLSALVAQLESGNLTVEELSEMEMITRELHERSIILRYNAFKNQVMPEADEADEEDDGAFIDENGGVEVEVIIEEIDENDANASDGESTVDQPQEEPTIDFSIFDDEPEEEASAPEEEPKSDPTPEPTPEPVVEKTPEPEPVLPEPIVEPEPEVANATDEESADDQLKPEPVEEKTDPIANGTSSAAQSFLNKLKLEDNSVASRFTSSKLDSLIGAFGLNERLRYINDLFDGSSEMFSDAIKALDSRSSLEEANLKAASLASEHDWDPEEEIVIEFMSYLNRRYA